MPAPRPDAAAEAGSGSPGGAATGAPKTARELLARQARAYHELPRPGKTEVVSTKPVLTQEDLSLAYTAPPT